MDNFYTSVSLAKQLLQKKVHLLGTLNKRRRHIPKTVLNIKLNEGDLYGDENQEGILVCKWQPKEKERYPYANHLPWFRHSGENKTMPRRNNHNKKPSVIVNYNYGQGGIDKADQMTSYATCIRKGVKWYY
ncbi:hypothetical protein JTB14_025056 [Gonioctena quinquepunctata]|nr:hypothetical protein JTB14_025056 [Gonioctena quinquepunctata]